MIAVTVVPRLLCYDAMMLRDFFSSNNSLSPAPITCVIAVDSQNNGWIRECLPILRPHLQYQPTTHLSLPHRLLLRYQRPPPLSMNPSLSACQPLVSQRTHN
ncbi:hypothetical protein AOLI_G00243640 [Acnodon oligacanthus]